MASASRRKLSATNFPSPTAVNLSGRDQVTVLFTEPTFFASKTWTTGTKGLPQCEHFDAGTFFRIAELGDVTDIFMLSELLTELEITPNAQ